MLISQTPFPNTSGPTQVMINHMHFCFLMHRELQGNEISHMRCGRAHTCCQQALGEEFQPPECIINIPSRAIIIQIPLYVM